MSQYKNKSTVISAQGLLILVNYSGDATVKRFINDGESVENRVL